MRFYGRFATLAASLALPLALCAPAFANSSCTAVSGNLVVNCGFETGDFTGWTLNDPSGNSQVDTHNPATGTYAATLGAEPGSLSQTIADTAGLVYNLSFLLDNEVAVDGDGTPYPGSNTLGVSIIDTNGNSTDLLSPTSIDQTNTYLPYSFSFVGSGSDTVLFSIDNVPSYYDLDDVVAKAPTPEPSSLALMGTGALVFAEITRRRVRIARSL